MGINIYGMYSLHKHNTILSAIICELKNPKLRSQMKCSNRKSIINSLSDLYHYCNKSTTAAHSHMRTSASVSPKIVNKNSAAAENTSTPQLQHGLFTHTKHRPNTLPPPAIPQ